MTESRNGTSTTREETRAFGRLLTAMVTPFTSSGDVDYGQAQRLAVALLDSGSEGMVVAGTTGEAPTLAAREKVDLFRAVKEAAGSRGSVLAGTGTYNTAESIELSREAERAGADGLLLTVPYYNKPTQEGLYRHFEAIAAATHLPCVLYNIPGRTSVNMAPETIVRAAGIPNIVGVKQATPNLAEAAQIIDGAGPDFRVWSGDDELTLPLLAIGGYGVISVTSHIAGRAFKGMIEAYLAGHVDEAAAIHRRLLPLMTALMTVATNPIPVKHALNKLGFAAGGVRLPLWDLDEAQSARLMAEVSKHRIDLLVGV
jgi:4-hydroxy-tetrahydrodipicolinate synthase